jgi:hypothetical protein
MSLMVLVVTGTPPKTANGADAAIIPDATVVRGVGSAVNRRSACARVLADTVACAAMAVDNCPNYVRRLAMSSLVTAIAAVGERGGD